MRSAELEQMKATGSMGCPRCGYGFQGFHRSNDGEYAWCPNCFRDDGSGGAGGIDGVLPSEDLNPSTRPA